MDRVNTLATPTPFLHQALWERKTQSSAKYITGVPGRFYMEGQGLTCNVGGGPGGKTFDWILIIYKFNRGVLAFGMCVIVMSFLICLIISKLSQNHSSNVTKLHQDRPIQSYHFGTH